MQRQSASAWLPMVGAQRSAEGARVFCFPYAGAGASVFRSWANALSPDIQVCPVEYPGRWGKHSTAYRNLSDLVQEAAASIGPFLGPGDSFFGYSYGAIVAFELARVLRRRGAIGPQCLLVGARRAPQLPARESLVHDLDDRAFIDCMERRFGAFPGAVRQDPDLMKLVVPMLRADMTALETYAYLAEEPLACPIVAFAGREDPLVQHEELEAWRAQTSAWFSSHLFEGGHFFTRAAETSVLQVVRRTLLSEQPTKRVRIGVHGF